MHVALPNRTLLANLGDRELTSERSFNVGREVLIKQQDRTNSLARVLFFEFAKINPTSIVLRYDIGVPSGLFGKPAVRISS